MRVPRRVNLREADVGFAGADQLQVGDRAAGDLRGRGHARHFLAEDVPEAAAERVIDAAGAAGRDRQLLRLLGIGGEAQAHGRGREAADQ